MDHPDELPFLSSIGLMLTYRCTIACPHCIVEAGPHRTEAVAEEQALDWIRQAAEYQDGRITGLALTGGEPFYDLPVLRRLSSYAADQGFIVSVVTNGYWAVDFPTALEVLATLPAIRMVSVSTDIYHQPKIPFAYIHNAVQAAHCLGRRVNVAVCTEDEDEPGFRQIMTNLAAIGEAEQAQVAITIPAGRAAARRKLMHFQYADEPTVSACTMASAPVIFPDGRVIACIGPALTLAPGQPLHLGNLNDEALAPILDRAEMNPALHMIRVWGPHRLAALLQEAGYGDRLPTRYIRNSICDVCYQIFSDPALVAGLEKVLADADLRRFVGYGRMFYLHEPVVA